MKVSLTWRILFYLGKEVLTKPVQTQHNFTLTWRKQCFVQAQHSSRRSITFSFQYCSRQTSKFLEVIRTKLRKTIHKKKQITIHTFISTLKVWSVVHLWNELRTSDAIQSLTCILLVTVKIYDYFNVQLQLIGL